jgi:hypothetical protein
MKSNYTRIYTGSFVIVQLLISKFEEIGISPLIKDETESARLAGFGPAIYGAQEVFVHESELDKAVPIVEETLAEMEV